MGRRQLFHQKRYTNGQETPAKQHGLCLLVEGRGAGMAGSSKFLPPPPTATTRTKDRKGQNPQRLTGGGGTTTVGTATSGRTLSIPWQWYAFEHTQKKRVHICTQKQVRTFRSAFVKPRDNSDTHEQQKE